MIENKGKFLSSVVQKRDFITNLKEEYCGNGFLEKSNIDIINEMRVLRKKEYQEFSCTNKHNVSVYREVLLIIISIKSNIDIIEICNSLEVNQAELMEVLINISVKKVNVELFIYFFKKIKSIEIKNLNKLLTYNFQQNNDKIIHFILKSKHLKNIKDLDVEESQELIDILFWINKDIEIEYVFIDNKNVLLLFSKVGEENFTTFYEKEAILLYNKIKLKINISDF